MCIPQIGENNTFQGKTQTRVTKAKTSSIGLNHKILPNPGFIVKVLNIFTDRN